MRSNVLFLVGGVLLTAEDSRAFQLGGALIVRAFQRPLSTGRRAGGALHPHSRWVFEPRTRRAAAARPCAVPASMCATSPSSSKSEVDVAEPAEGKTARVSGKGHGHGGMSKADPNSFVQGDMRKAAMRLHTRDQAPREGEQENRGKKFSEWAPTRPGYLQFLVDSRAVYAALEEAVNASPALETLRDTGLERVAALDEDIAWLLVAYPEDFQGGVAPEASATGKEYAEFLSRTARESPAAFVCHFYNHYFAHTAGGIMIGRKVADACLGGRTLEFYKWGEGGGGDVRALLEAVRERIDAMAAGWGPEEREACLEETGRSFAFGGRLLSSISS